MANKIRNIRNVWFDIWVCIWIFGLILKIQARRTVNAIRNWWERLADPNTYREPTVKARLRVSRNNIVIFVLTTLFASLYANAGIKPVLMATGACCAGFCATMEILRMQAISRGRADRQDFERTLGRLFHLFRWIAIVLVVLPVLIHENVLGVFTPFTNSYPWLEGGADHIIWYINQLVAELVEVFHELPF